MGSKPQLCLSLEQALQKEASSGELYGEWQVKCLGQTVPPSTLSTVAVLFLLEALSSLKTAVGVHLLT